jgi:hypothetical protein
MFLVSTVRRAARLTAAVIAGAATTLALTVPAQAHIPVVLTSANTAAALQSSPYVPDGTVSFAFYGWLDRPGDTRSVRIHLDAGEQLYAQLLIPDLAPENNLDRWQTPRLAIVDPRGRVQLLRNDRRESFHEEFTDTDYLILSETTRAARDGTYALIVAGAAPSRFVAVSGSKEQFFADIQNARIGTVADVLNWYETPVSPDRAASGIIS